MSGLGTHTQHAAGPRGFTIIELVTIVGVVMVVGALVGVAGQPPAAPAPAPDKAPAPTAPDAQNPSLLASLAKARASARQLRCSIQVRGITQSLIIWAANNRGEYPLPSELDGTGDTVADKGRAKDTTANIYSVLIFNGNISPEICICPDEQNAAIRRYDAYEYSSPKKAVKPANALWDPAFSADFTGKRGNASYAHLQPSGDFKVTGEKGAKGNPMRTGEGRLAMWSDTYASTEAIAGDRGPQIESAAVAPDEPDAMKAAVTVKTTIPDSKTLKIHGAPTSWEGNIAYNDNHVNFETTLGPPVGPSRHTYRTQTDVLRPDCIYLDEPNDPKSVNTFLGLFTTAGKKPSDFRAIWD